MVDTLKESLSFAIIAACASAGLLGSMAASIFFFSPKFETDVDFFVLDLDLDALDDDDEVEDVDNTDDGDRRPPPPPTLIGRSKNADAVAPTTAARATASADGSSGGEVPELRILLLLPSFSMGFGDRGTLASS